MYVHWNALNIARHGNRIDVRIALLEIEPTTLCTFYCENKEPTKRDPNPFFFVDVVFGYHRHRLTKGNIYIYIQ